MEGIPLEEPVLSITTLSFESNVKVVPLPAISLRNIPLLNKTVPVPDVVTILSCLKLQPYICVSLTTLVI